MWTVNIWSFVEWNGKVIDEWIIGSDLKGIGHNLDTISEFAWRDGIPPRETSVRIADGLADVRTRHRRIKRLCRYRVLHLHLWCRIGFELHWKVTVSGEYVRIVKIAVPVPVFAWRDCGKVRKSWVRIDGKSANIQIVCWPLIYQGGSSEDPRGWFFVILP